MTVFINEEGEMRTQGRQSVAILQGYNCASGEVLNTALEGEITEGGEKGTTFVHVCNSGFAVRSVLELSENAMVGLSEIGNISERRALYQDLSMSETSVAVIVKATRNRGEIQLKNAHFKPNEVAQPTSIEEALKFFLRYGDTYVSSLTQGAEYYAVFTSNCIVYEAKSELLNALKVNGIFDGMNLDASLAARIQTITSKYGFQWKFRQSLIGTKGVNAPDFDNFIKFAMEFPSTPVDKIAGVIDFSVTGYEHVLENPDCFKQIGANRAALFSSGPGAHKESILAVREQLLSAENECKAISKVYSGFSQSLDSIFKNNQLAIGLDLDRIESVLQEYASDPTKPIGKDQLRFNSLDLGSPELSCEQIVSKKFGADGGAYFRAPRVPEEIPLYGCPIKMDFRGDRFVNRFGIEYRPIEGSSRRIEHGGEYGKPTPELVISPGDCIQQIKIYAGVYVDYLKIKLKNGGSLEVGTPPDNKDLIVSMFDADHNGCFIGFEGRSDKWIDMLISVSIKFNQVQWRAQSCEDRKDGEI